ncbi:MAG: hypothetical protein NT069_31610 [Planctomycetota bacterium]|nr:hypothetical protein [Planctomycetota bacterium]
MNGYQNGCTQASQDTTTHTHVLCVPPIDDAILQTIPGPGDSRDECLFRFARHVKAIYPNLDLLLDQKLLRGILLQRHEFALPNIPKTSQKRDFEIQWRDFVWKLECVRTPIGRPRLEEAELIAKTVELPACARHFQSEPFKQLVRFCVALHQVHRGGQFPLSCRIAGTQICKSHKYAALMIKKLVDCGILVVADASYLSGKRSREYRYIGEANQPNQKTEPESTFPPKATSAEEHA